ncbi:nucleotidyltransferase family protein [Maribacter sp. 2210JD10-5]|uniref:nucleotidyltransferase family protein n=1 Tax=Maribacter sp. 2210JD10-5 TaxID=3386272 RepID=UPI0039BD46BC
MTTKSNIGILILAAGRSSRMQSIKQLLPWEHENLLLNAIHTALKTTANQVFIVLGASAHKIKKACSLEVLNVEIIMNDDWKKGLGSSIATSVQYFNEKKYDLDGILVMLADQPLFTVTYFNEMLAEFKQERHKIVSTAYGSRAGVPAVFHKSLFDELLDLSEDFGAKEIMKKYANLNLVLDSGKMNQDIDTQETYHELYHKYH